MPLSSYMYCLNISENWKLFIMNLMEKGKTKNKMELLYNELKSSKRNSPLLLADDFTGNVSGTSDGYSSLKRLKVASK